MSCLSFQVKSIKHVRQAVFVPVITMRSMKIILMLAPCRLLMAATVLMAWSVSVILQGYFKAIFFKHTVLRMERYLIAFGCS